MERKKKDSPWRAHALRAVLWMLAALIQVLGMVRRGSASGWGILVALLFLTDAAVFAARAVSAFYRRDSDKKLTKDDNMIDGGTFHD